MTKPTEEVPAPEASDFDPTAPMPPLKTWSHLAKQRRRPSEYEVVSTNLLWSTDGDMPWALNPEIPLNKWYLSYRNGSPLRHDDWDGFRDPDQLVYRTYNILQDGQETYVDGLLDEFSDKQHDKGLDADWIAQLARLYTPGRYLIHSVQMASAYLVQIVPASTIENCAMLQSADQLRWVSRIAYRTKELSYSWPDTGFGAAESTAWEQERAWLGFRELMEKVLCAYDWGEHFVALQLVAKPAIDEAFLRQLGTAAQRNGDTLLGLLLAAQMTDSDRSRRWTRALADYAAQSDGNRALMAEWIAKWEPLGDQAIEAFCAELPDNPEAAREARRAVREFRANCGFDA